MSRDGDFKRCGNAPHDFPEEGNGPLGKWKADWHWWNNGEGRYWPEGDERNNDYWCDGSAPEAEGDQ